MTWKDTEEGWQEFPRQVLGDTSGLANTILVAVGDRLGLFRELARAGPATGAELAARTGVSEWYAHDWLAGMAVTSYLEYDPTTERFALPDASVHVVNQLYAGLDRPGRPSTSPTRGFDVDALRRPPGPEDLGCSDLADGGGAEPQAKGLPPRSSRQHYQLTRHRPGPYESQDGSCLIQRSGKAWTVIELVDNQPRPVRRVRTLVEAKRILASRVARRSVNALERHAPLSDDPAAPGAQQVAEA